MKTLFLILIITTKIFASIFYGDDRKDFHEIKEPKIKELSASIPSLIQKEKLIEKDDHWQINTKSLENSSYKFCSDANFAQEKLLANCSASLIAPDLVLTAAHCLEKDWVESIYHPRAYMIVFDYKKTHKDEEITKLPKENVYEIEDNMPLYEYSWNNMLDVAILKLKRPVTDRRPIKLNLNHDYSTATPLFVFGYPLGVSQKLTDESNIISVGETQNSFRHYLDTFSVNSGSAIFDKDTYEIIGVHVRGTMGKDPSGRNDCRDWRVGIPGEDYGEANMLSPLKNQIEKILEAN